MVKNEQLQDQLLADITTLLKTAAYCTVGKHTIRHAFYQQESDALLKEFCAKNGLIFTYDGHYFYVFSYGGTAE
jgi:hypothetical protein